LGARLTPTFILFDTQGNELWRMMGGLDVAALREMLGRL
jgi:thioredoxin-related protein